MKWKECWAVLGDPVSSLGSVWLQGNHIPSLGLPLPLCWVWWKWFVRLSPSLGFTCQSSSRLDKSTALAILDSLSALDLGPGTGMQSVRAGMELQVSLFQLQASWSRCQLCLLWESQSSRFSAVPRFPHAIVLIKRMSRDSCSAWHMWTFSDLSFCCNYYWWKRQMLVC